MKCTGELKNLSINYESHRPEITLTVDARIEDLEKLKDKKLSVEVKQYREHRSLNANSYYYALCSQIANVLGEPLTYTHNLLLRQYGQIETIDGNAVYLVLPDTDEATAKADLAETFHIKPTSEVKAGNDGKMYRTYVLMKGSHEFNTKEMARLIDGTIKEAQALGIDTITDNEKVEMLIAYGKKHTAR